MDSTASDAGKNSSQTARPGPLEKSTHLQSNPEPHQRNPQDHHQETSAELQRYDNKARIWILIYVCWLIWNIYASLPESLQLEQIGSSFIVLVFVAAPYFIQLWGIHQRNLEATNLGIKILCAYGVFIAVCFVTTLVAHFYSAEVFAFAENLLQKAPESGEEVDLMELPDRKITEEGLQTAMKDFGISFACYVVGYFAARKYRSYLNRRETFFKKSQ